MFMNRRKVQYENSTTQSTYCDQTTYLFAFWSIIVIYIVAAFVGFLVILFGLSYIFVYSFWNRKNKN